MNSAKCTYESINKCCTCESQNKCQNSNDITLIFTDDNRNFFLLKKAFLFAKTVEDFVRLYSGKKRIKNHIDYLKSFDYIIINNYGNFGEPLLENILQKNNITYFCKSAVSQSGCLVYFYIFYMVYIFDIFSGITN